MKKIHTCALAGCTNTFEKLKANKKYCCDEHRIENAKSKHRANYHEQPKQKDNKKHKLAKKWLVRGEPANLSRGSILGC